uniref:Bulb-type lectin domain-containing protein n=1 Tax=Hucho hucho TaxID=62062 RepID=A0A4W5NKE9_9TELE
MSRNFLSKNDELRKGDFILSNNREWKAVFQVCYFNMSIVNISLSLYSSEDSPMWHTNTSKPSWKMCRIHLKDDGTLVLEKNRVDIWSSNEVKLFLKSVTTVHISLTV